jgi:hypothetical protein
MTNVAPSCCAYRLVTGQRQPGPRHRTAALWLKRRVRWPIRRPGSLRPTIWVVWPAVVAVGKLVAKS